MVLRLLIIGFIVAPSMIFKKCYTSYDQANLRICIDNCFGMISNYSEYKDNNYIPKVIIQNISSPLRLNFFNQLISLLEPFDFK